MRRSVDAFTQQNVCHENDTEYPCTSVTQCVDSNESFGENENYHDQTRMQPKANVLLTLAEREKLGRCHRGLHRCFPAERKYEQTASSLQSAAWLKSGSQNLELICRPSGTVNPCLYVNDDRHIQLQDTKMTLFEQHQFNPKKQLDDRPGPGNKAPNMCIFGQYKRHRENNLGSHLERLDYSN